MKAAIKYLLLSFSIAFTAVSAQSSKKITMDLSFPDSISIILENTRQTEAMIIGGSFPVAWNNLGIDQQQRIQKQVYAMKRKGYKLRPHLVQYFGSIVNAVSVEGADIVHINSYLSVVDKVIENYPINKALKFLYASNTFFKRHALYYDKTYRLYARDDNYTFEFLEYIPPPIEDPLPVDDQDTEWDWNNEPEDTAPIEMAPYWETQPPPPLVEGAVIRFNSVSLNMVTSYDSVFVKNTKGVFSLTDNLFVGEGGKFDWSPAGLDPEKVNCNFTEYSLDVRKPEIKSNLVRLNYVGITTGSVPGVFEFRSQSRRSNQLSSYPRFTSYENTLTLNGLGPDRMKYTGGLSLHGSVIKSTNINKELATIVVHDSIGSKKFTARSKEFLFKDSLGITSDHTMFTIYQRNDSISHNSIQMKYDYNNDRVVLLSEKGQLRNTPFTASFFNMDFSAALIRWDLHADSLNVYSQMSGSTVPMTVESVDYFHPEDMVLLRGVGFNFHPLAVFARYCIENNTREAYTGAIAQNYGLDILHVQKAAEFLEIKGLVQYVRRGDRVIVKEKAITQYLAWKGESDYDNLRINSQPGSYALTNLTTPRYPNATVNFASGTMTVRGVERFSVSDSLNVIIEPDSSVITVLQNRDIKFNGKITAGNFEITGKEFTLKYDSFFINMKHIDSLNFYSM